MGTRKRRPPAPSKAAASEAANPAAGKILSFLERRSLPVALALVVLASIRIAATYTVFNHTSDEPAHIACGMEWLADGTYRWEPQHPPLARVATAIGPYLLGIRSQHTPRNALFGFSKEGTAILYAGHHYDLTLSLARLGILPFFWACCAVVYWWGKRYFGAAAAVTAVFLFTFLPTILAHSGLATTDIAHTATMAGAFLLGAIWLEDPTPPKAAWFGVALGLMVLSKFSCLLFFPAGCAFGLAWYWVRERPRFAALISMLKARIPTLGLALAIGLLLIWAGYRFHVGDSGIAHLRLPAPELYAGIRQVSQHNAEGHDSFLLGKRGNTGFWYFYPVAIAFKTPIAFLILMAVGFVMMFRKEARFGPLWIPLAFAVGILLPAAFSRITIGVRHVMPVYISFALVSAMALLRMLELSATRKWLLAVCGALVLWLAVSSLASHPDYLPYFNELAGSEPEKILADSDLDWGQDLKRLSARLREGGATEVSFDKYIIGDWEKEHGFPKIYPLNQMSPRVGWNAIGVGLWKESRLVLWPDWTKPHERVGKSILLWYFPAPNSSAGIVPR